MLNFRYDFFWQAIFKPYPVISYLALAFWFAVGVRTSADWIGKKLGSQGRILPPVISVCVLVGILSANFVRNNRADSTWVEQYGRAVLQSLPMNSVFFLRGDFEYGLFGYLHYVMEVRPDIELRSWDNLLFSNRLVSPHESDEVQQRERTEFLEREIRPVFTISAGLSPSTQLGGYYRYFPDQPKSVDRNPAMDAFLDYFLDLYLGGHITDPHENYFAFYRIVNFARQYVGLALKHQGLSEVELRRLERLQLTFPGKLATLETLIGTGSGIAGKEVLLDFANAAEDQIPEFITNESLAVFYEFYGRAHAMEPSDNELAIRYFEKSIQELPIQTNTSLCPLIRLYRSENNQSENNQSEGNQSKLSFVLAHYSALECQ
jgi:hypothetical protein